MIRLRRLRVVVVCAMSAALTVGTAMDWANAHNYKPNGCSLKMTAEVVWKDPADHSLGKTLRWGAPGTTAELTRALGGKAQPPRSTWCNPATCPTPTVCQVDPVHASGMEAASQGQGTGQPSGHGKLVCSCIKTRKGHGGNWGADRVVFPDLPG